MIRNNPAHDTQNPPGQVAPAEASQGGGVAAYQYLFDGPYGPVWRNSSAPWNGLAPKAHRPLFTHPPKLVPLTKTDIARVFREVYGGTRFDGTEYEFARTIERKLAEKNGIPLGDSQ